MGSYLFLFCFDVCMKYFNSNLFSFAKLNYPLFWIPDYLEPHIAAIHLILKASHGSPSCRNVRRSDTAPFCPETHYLDCEVIAHSR